MKLINKLKGFVRSLRNPGPSLRPKPTQAQKDEITEAIRKQRFHGDIPGRQYPD